ncbi:MAG: efflux RND transporter periplasmic adaptor subunit [Pseudomonadales bacterium]
MTSARKVLMSLGALLFLALVLAYFSGVFHDKVQPKQAARLEVPGEVLVTAREDMPVTAPIPGTVNPTDETVIGSRLLATVTRVHVRAGNKVEQGAPLVDFDDSSLKAVLQQREQAAASARAALDDTQRNRDRAVSLFESGNLSRADYDRAMTNARVAEAEWERASQAVAEARTQLGYTRAVAPISGTVVERYIEPGDTATPGQPLLKLFNPGRMRVEAILRESLIRFVEPGATLTAHVDALDATVDSVVEEIVPSADPGSRTFLIKVLLPALPDLYPGMFARLEIPVGRQARLLLPEEAVQRSGQLEFVYVRTAEGVDRRFVRTGEHFDGRVDIVTGLEPGVEVILPQPGTQ